MSNQPPYLNVNRIHYVYNPEYGDDRICECGHRYDRHFFEETENVGCKYCICHEFVEGT